LGRSPNSRSITSNKLLDAGVDAKEIPLPHEFLLNPSIMADLYPSFAKGLAPFFTLNWAEYSDFLTFKGGLNPVTGGLWLSDTAHHHLAIAVLFLVLVTNTVQTGVLVTVLKTF